jgi:coproporphyrinogen III oxidase-like Fe-S oxidoreductase
MVNLRTSEGIVRDEFIEQTGFDPFIIYAETLDRFCRAGLLEIVENRIRLSRSGLILSNEVIAELLC